MLVGSTSSRADGPTHPSSGAAPVVDKMEEVHVHAPILMARRPAAVGGPRRPGSPRGVAVLHARLFPVLEKPGAPGPEPGPRAEPVTVLPPRDREQERIRWFNCGAREGGAGRGPRVRDGEPRRLARETSAQGGGGPGAMGPVHARGAARVPEPVGFAGGKTMRTRVLPQRAVAHLVDSFFVFLLWMPIFFRESVGCRSGSLRTTSSGGSGSPPLPSWRRASG